MARQPAGQADTFNTILKGAVGFSVLLTAAAGTLQAWMGHPAITDTALYAASGVGAALGAVVAYRACQSPP